MGWMQKRHRSISSSVANRLICPLFAEPRGRGWYIAYPEMREVRGVTYLQG